MVLMVPEPIVSVPIELMVSNVPIVPIVPVPNCSVPNSTGWEALD